MAIGWGKLSEFGETATTLQQVSLNIIDYRSSTCMPLIHDQNIQLCAGVKGGGKG